MRTEVSLGPPLVAGLGVTFFALLDAAMKVILQSYPLMQATTMRYGTGAAFATIIYLVYSAQVPSLAALGRNAVRALIVVGTALCFFVAIRRLPLAEAVALTFLSPLFMALLGRLILRETASRLVLCAALVGFCGVVIIALGQQRGDAGGLDLIGIVAALGNAILYAFSMILMRRQTAHDSIFTIVFLSNCIAFFVVAPTGIWTWQPVAATHWLLAAIVGLVGTCGHFCLAWAYARGQAAQLGVMEYSAFVWAIILGYYFFGETPSGWTLAGATLIIGSCLIATLNKAGGRKI